MRASPWPLGIFATFALAGCATLIGIDKDYGDRPGSGGAGLSTGADPPFGGAAGMSASSSGGMGGSLGGSGPSANVSSSSGASSSSSASSSSGSTGASGAAGAGGGPASVSPILGAQSGTTTVLAGASVTKASISPVDPSHSFLVFSSLFNSTSPSDTEFSGQITAPGEVTFARGNGSSAPAVPIQYYVAQFQSGVAVQRGTMLMSANMTSVALSSTVDLTKSFPLLTLRTSGSVYGTKDFVRAKLTAPTTMTLNVAAPATGSVLEWQVVTFDGATVQSGDFTFTSGDAVVTALLPNQVDPAKTWLVFSYTLDSATGTAAEMLFRGMVDSSTQVSFHRAGIGAPGMLTWYAITFTNGTTVQSALQSTASAAATVTAPLKQVNPGSSIAALGGVYQRFGNTSYTTDRNVGYGGFTVDIGAGAQVTATRGVTGAVSWLDWFVIDFF